MVTDMNNCPYHHQACPYPGGGEGGGAYYPYHHLGCSYPGGRGRGRGLLPISPLGLFISWREGGGAYYSYHHLGCSYPGGRGEGLITHITTWVVHILEGGGRGRGLLLVSPLGLFISRMEGGGGGAYYPYHHLGCSYPGGRVEEKGLITHITTWVVHILEGGGRGRGLLPISPLGLFISWREGGGAYYPYHHLGCSYPGGRGKGLITHITTWVVHILEGRGWGEGRGYYLYSFWVGVCYPRLQSVAYMYFRPEKTTFYTHFQIKLQKSIPNLHVRPDEIYIPIENQSEKTINI